MDHGGDKQVGSGQEVESTGPGLVRCRTQGLTCRSSTVSGGKT